MVPTDRFCHECDEEKEWCMCDEDEDNFLDNERENAVV